MNQRLLLDPPAAGDEDATRRKGCASRSRRDALIGPCPRVWVWFLAATGVGGLSSAGMNGLPRLRWPGALRPLWGACKRLWWLRCWRLVICLALV